MEIWYQSSAVGVACAGRLYFSASFSVAVLLTLLRFGPRLDDKARDMAHSDEHHSSYSATGTFMRDETSSDAENVKNPEMQSLRRLDPSMKSVSFRQRASLGGLM